MFCSFVTVTQMEPIHKYGVTWYPFFNNEECSKHLNLLENISIYGDTILIATMNRSSPRFAKFNTLMHFYEYFNRTNITHRTYYAVLIQSCRYIYLDIDYKIQKQLSDIQINALIIKLRRFLNKFILKYGKMFNIQYEKCDWFIWNASRSTKFSLHLMDIGNVINVIDNKHFAIAFNYWLHHNNQICMDCVIDQKIYHEHYQLWRLPYNHNGNIESLLQLHDSHMSLYQQFKISFMNDVRHVYRKCISISSSISNGTLKIFKSLDTDTPQKKILKTVANISYASSSHINEINNISISLHAKLSNIFQSPNIRSYKNGELLISKHYCPISNKIHQHNTGRLRILQSSSIQDIMYCKYYCMKPECRNIKQSKNISLHKNWNYPWLMCLITQINYSILQEVDAFCHLLFKHHHIAYYKGCYEDNIIKINKLQINTKYLFSSFIEDNIMHTKCKQNNMFLYYIKPRSDCIESGVIMLQCKYCCKRISMNNHQLKFFK